MTDEHIVTEEYFVAYLDLLGTSDKILHDEGEEYYLNALYSLYHDLLEYRQIRNHPVVDYRQLKIRIFSDNIVIACKYDNDYDIKLKSIITFTSELQYRAFKDYSWLLRGGITKGKFYIDENFVWGEALIKAYDIEENISKSPRVVVDGELLSELRLSTEEIKNYNIRQDTDGYYYIGYMNNRFMTCNNSEAMKDMAEHHESLLLKYSSNMSVFQKYLWGAKYHNIICDESDALGNNEKVRFRGEIL